MIQPNDFDGVEEDVARRVLVAARSIAPCIDSFPDESEDKKNAIAIIKGVIADLPVPGSRRIRSQRVGPAAVEYTSADSWLPEDRDALRSLCSAANLQGMPRGSFPKPDPAIAAMWPEIRS